MLKNISLDNQIFHVGDFELPALIHGKQGKGASLFTVSLIAHLYAHGNKVIFLSGYPMARNELIAQIDEAEVSLANDSINDTQVIFIPKERADLLTHASMVLPDFEQRVVLIKNIELFDNKPFEAVHEHSRLVLSGDLDKCSYAVKILKSPLKSKVFFSKPTTDLGIQIPNLDKYEGYYLSINQRGVLKVSS